MGGGGGGTGLGGKNVRFFNKIGTLRKKIIQHEYRTVFVNQFLSPSLLYLSSCSLHPPRGLWWKNVKWSRFCEHHLAARALIAPITSLTFLPAHYTTVVPLTLCTAGGESRRATHNGTCPPPSLFPRLKKVWILTTTRANLEEKNGDS